MGRRGSGMSVTSTGSGAGSGSGSGPGAEWFLARDGQQFGPVSDVEFRKLVELGHLKPADLVWREGLPDWQAAGEIMAQLMPRSMSETDRAPPLDQHPAPSYGQPGQSPAQAEQAYQQAQRTFEARSRPRTIAPEPMMATRGVDLRHAEPADAQRFDGLRVDEPVEPQGQRPSKRKSRPTEHRERAKNVSPSRIATAGRWFKRAAVIVFFGSTLSAAAWYAYPHRADIMRIASAVTGSIGGDNSAPMLSGFSADANASDVALQKIPLWKVLKRDYPDWYSARVKEASELSRTGKPDAAVALHVADTLAKLRRQYAGDALSATPAQLTAVAVSFTESLTRLRRHSIDACYTYISSGESNPVIVPLLQSPELAGPLQRQLLAVFNAVAEGRKTPRVYPPPKQSDYDVLVKELEARGWTQADMQLFSDSRALAKATPEKVCSMVTQWFESQIAIKDPDTQLRLLVDSLRPVVAG